MNVKIIRYKNTSIFLVRPNIRLLFSMSVLPVCHAPFDIYMTCRENEHVDGHAQASSILRPTYFVFQFSKIRSENCRSLISTPLAHAVAGVDCKRRCLGGRYLFLPLPLSFAFTFPLAFPFSFPICFHLLCPHTFPLVFSFLSFIRSFRFPSLLSWPFSSHFPPTFPVSFPPSLFSSLSFVLTLPFF